MSLTISATEVASVIFFSGLVSITSPYIIPALGTK